MCVFLEMVLVANVVHVSYVFLSISLMFSEHFFYYGKGGGGSSHGYEEGSPKQCWSGWQS
jgi:hypothetical protein